MIEQIKSLHACWCSTTGQTLNLRATERIFFELAQLDFTADDLLLVLKHVLAYNRAHADCPMKVQVHKICGCTETFASLAAESQAKERNKVKKPTPREIVLEDFRGFKPEARGNCVPIKEVFAKLREVTS